MSDLKIQYDALEADYKEVQADFDAALELLGKSWLSHQVAFVSVVVFLGGVIIGYFI